MTEGRFYRVLWNREADGYITRLAIKPSVAAAGASLDEALDQLAIFVLDEYGDGEPQWSLDPPPEVHPAIAGFARFTTVHPYADWDVTNAPEELFEGPRCDVCESVHGRRTARRLSLGKRDGRGHLATWVAEAGVTGVVFDEVALEELPAALISEFDVVPCDVPRRTRTSWFELQPKWSVHVVRWKRLKYQSPNAASTRAHQRYDPRTPFVPHAPCPACGGFKPYDYYTSKCFDALYFAADELPMTDPPAFALQCHKNWTLAVNSSLWSDVRSVRAFAHVFDDTVCCALPSDQLAILDDSMAKPIWPATRRQ